LFLCKIQSRQHHGASAKWGGDGDSDERDENTVSVRKKRGVDLESMPNLLMAAILSHPPNPCCFTIFFLVAMFDFWPILWMASLHCFFPHLFHTMQQ
jgi:hypothetical protein